MVVQSVDIFDLVWLSGFLEGEGSFLPGPPSEPNLPIIRVATTDRDVCEHAAKLMGVSVVPIRSVRYKENGWKQPFLATVRGKRAVNLMHQLRKFMGERRRQQIDRAIASYRREVVDLTSANKEEIVKLCKSGMRQREVAKLVGVCRETVNRIYNAHKKVNNGTLNKVA